MKCFAVTAMLILTVTLPVGVSAQQYNEKASARLTIGTSTLGSSSYAASQTLAKLVAEANPHISVNVEAIGGTDASMNAINAGIAQLATGNALSATNAYYGAGPFGKVGKIDIRLIAQGQESIRPIVVLRRSGIRQVPDLMGKRLIAKRRSLAELEKVADAMFEAYGISERERPKFIATANTKETIEALKLRSVDAAIIPGYVPTALLSELAASEEIDFISVQDDKMSAMLDKLGPAWFASTVPAGTYNGLEKDVQVPAIPSAIAASASLDDEVAYTIVKTLFENAEKNNLLAKAASLDITLKNKSVPFHSGAIKYFKQKGLWTPELERTQERLLRRDQAGAARKP